MNRSPVSPTDFHALLLIATLAMIFAACGTPAVPAISADAAPTQPTDEFISELGRSSDGPEYYVSETGDDAGDGSVAHPWASINRANRIVTPGATIHVGPGRYRDSIVTSVSGSPDRRIRYISDKKWGAIVDPRRRGIFAWKNTGNYTDIIGFDISGSDCNGIGLGGSSQRAIGNNVHNAAIGCNDDPQSGSGINDFDYATHGNEIIENYVHDVGAIDPLCGRSGHEFIHGIYQANAGGRIAENVSANNCAFGIHLWHAATRATIANNTVVGNRSGGIIVGSGDAPCTNGGCPGGDDFTIVSNNIVAYNGLSGSSGWGIIEESESGGITGAHNQYIRNLSFKNARGDFSLDHNLTCNACIRGQDPKFVSAASGNYELRDGSPALLPAESGITGISRGDKRPLSPTPSETNSSRIGALVSVTLSQR